MSRSQLGSYLRETRESRGLQLEDVSRTTRISKNYLVALEQGEFQKLPNAAYVKGFLRLYAGVIGLAGDEVVAIYERADDPSTVVEDEDSKPVKFRTKSSNKGLWLLPLFIFAAVLVVALFMQRQDEKKTTVTSPVSRPEVPQAIPPVQPALSSARLNQDQATVTNALPSEPVPLVAETQQEGIFLKLKCNQDSSLNITIDDSLSQHYELKAGDVIEWKAETSFALDIGNAGGVEAEFNGKTMKLFGAAGVSTHVVLKAGGKE